MNQATPSIVPKCTKLNVFVAELVLLWPWFSTVNDATLQSSSGQYYVAQELLWWTVGNYVLDTIS